MNMATNEDWKTEAFRANVVSQIEEAVRQSISDGNISMTRKTPSDMEAHLYNKAQTRDDYMTLVARLLFYIRDIRKLGEVENEFDSWLSSVKGVQYDKLPPHITPDHSDVYPMTCNPRGLAVIINNINFSPKKEYTEKRLDRREGSEVDVQKLENLFQELHFSVHVHEDLTGQEMTNKVLRYSRDDHSAYDAFVLCLMSHGEEYGIYGTDGQNVDTDEFRSMFNGSKCTSLAGKPKLIIVQACRGGKIDEGAYGPHNTETQKPEDDKKEVWSIDFAGNETSADKWKTSDDESETIAGEGKTIADAADFAVAYASVNGFASFRNKKEGSRFIQAISDVFCECAGYEHLMDMLTKVNLQVSKFGARNNNKQIPQPQSTLTKKLYFWPGIYHNAAKPTV